MAFVGMNAAGGSRERSALRSKLINNGSPKPENLDEKPALGERRSLIQDRRSQKANSFSIGSSGALLIAAGLLMASGSSLIQILQLPVTTVFSLAGMVFATLGVAFVVSERRSAGEQNSVSDATSQKIDQLTSRLDEGIESLRDAQWEMRDSELRYRDLLDHQLDIIMRRDRAGRISFINDAFCQTFGGDQNATIGALFEPTYVEGSTSVPFGQFGKDERYHYEQQLMTLQGPRWFSFEDVAIRDDDLELREVHTVGRDITEEKKNASNLQEARDLAEDANHAKTRFLATMSHEIRTPMNGIMGMTDLLTESNLSPEQRTYCHAINKSATTLLSLIDEILDFSKIEAGKFKMDKKPYNLVDFAQGVVELLAPRAFEKKLSLGCFISPDLCDRVIGDEMRLRQILLNLIGNAIKFTDRGGVTLEISAAGKRGEILRFSVMDTGIGLSKSDMERVFVEFEQVDSSNARRNGGTGLGLAITRRLVNKMGGEISVKSVQGRGSVFMVDMALENAQGGVPLRKLLVSPGHVKRALIACDHEVEGQLIGKMLKSQGVDVVVLDRRMAYEMLEDKVGDAFDVLVTDAVEASDFAQKLSRMAAQHAGRPVKGLMLIEATDRHDYEALRSKGYDSYVTRPVRHISLLRQLETLGSPSIVPHPEPHQSNFAPKALNPIEPSSPGNGQQTPISGNKQKPRILLAEDNEINALLGCRLLEHMGYDVTHVTDGEQALSAIKNAVDENRFDVVLMDIHMPRMDGIKATQEIRAFEDHSGRFPNPVPIIALTANAFDEVKSECYSVGMNAYLAKPFARDELYEIIESCLSSRAEILF